MGSPLKQASFVGGEVAPSLHARVDLAAYRSWLKTCRNFTIRPQGGLRNRPGTQLVDTIPPPQPVPTPAYVLALGPTLWLDAPTSLTAYADDTDLTVNWPDISGNGNHMISGPPPNSTLWPKVRTNFVFDGRAVELRSINRCMTIVGVSEPAILIAADAGWTAFVVWRANAAGSVPFHPIGLNHGTSSLQEGITLPPTTGGPVRISYNQGVGDTPIAISSSISPAPGSSHITAIRRNSSDDTHTVIHDGVDISIGYANNADIFFQGLFTLDANSVSDPTNAIAELILFSTTLSTGDTNGVLAYLNEKYGVDVFGGDDTTSEDLALASVERPVMLIPFVFNQSEAYILEFGHLHIRVIRNGARVLVDDSPEIATFRSTTSQHLVNMDSPRVWCSQGFVSTRLVATDVAEIRVWLDALLGSSLTGVQVAIYDDNAGEPGSVVPGLDFTDWTTLEAEALTTEKKEYSFTLLDPDASVPLAVGTTYHLVLKALDSGTGNGVLAPPCSLGDQYSGGDLFTSTDGITWDAPPTPRDLWFTVLGPEADGTPVTIVTPYTAEEVAALKGRTAQSGDVMFIPHQNHPPQELRRLAEASWDLIDLENLTRIEAPATPTVTDGDDIGSAFNPIKQWWYVVTAISGLTGGESFGSAPLSAVYNISSVEPLTLAIPVVSGASGYNVYRGRNAGVYGYVGTTSGPDFLDDGQAPDYSTTPIIDPDGTLQAPPATAAPTLLTFEPFTPFLLEPFGQVSGWVAFSAIAADESYTSTPQQIQGQFLQWQFTLSAVVGATIYWMYKGTTPHNMRRVKSSATTTIIFSGENPGTDGPVIPLPNMPPGPPPITFDTEDNFPSVAAFVDQRLMLAGTNNKPDTIFGSRLGDYRDFSAAVPAGDDDAFEFTLAALTVDRIRGLVHSSVLLGFTTSSEYVIKGTRDGAIGPASIDAKAHAHYGSGDIAPLAVGGRVLFAQPEGQAVREFHYDFQQDGYTADDERSVLAKHLLDNHEIVDWAYAKGPDSTVWMVRDDGILLGMTYMPQHDVIAWHTHDTDGEFESVATIPEGNETAVYVVVKRTINGETQRFIERFASRQIENVEDSVFLDCSLTYESPDFSDRMMTIVEDVADAWGVGDEGTATITGDDYFDEGIHVGSQIVLTDADGNEVRLTIIEVTSPLIVDVRFERDIPAEFQVSFMGFVHALKVFDFSHMIGEAVSALVDGNVVSDLTVDDDGSVTLPFAGATVTIGKPYVSEIETLDINVDGRNLQTVQKIVGKVWFDFVASRGAWAGEDTNRMTEWRQRQVPHGSPNAGAATPPFTGRDYVQISGGWNHSGRVIVQQRDPLPLEITAVTPEVTFGGG